MSVFNAYMTLSGAVDADFVRDEPLSRRTSYRIGGPAALVAHVRDYAALARTVEVLADEVHITNVISNLVDNAIKYCTKAPEISIYTRNKDKDIIISVIDNGIGIAKKDQKLVFERFYRVSTGNLHDVKGFGLGLSYVKKIVEAHGGRVELESSPGKGSCFSVIFPPEPEEINS